MQGTIAVPNIFIFIFIFFILIMSPSHVDTQSRDRGREIFLPVLGPCISAIPSGGKAKQGSKQAINFACIGSQELGRTVLSEFFPCSVCRLCLWVPT